MSALYWDDDQRQGSPDLTDQIPQRPDGAGPWPAPEALRGANQALPAEHDAARTAETFEQPIFAATITPHRALSQAGFRLVMTLVCLVCVVSSIPFMVMGAWPVAGFFGLDLLALFIAFRVNYRSAGSVEEVVLTRISLLLTRVTHRGQRIERRFNPLWTRLDRNHDDEFGLVALTLVSRGERVVIARELSPPERETFADEFGRALSDVKRGY